MFNDNFVDKIVLPVLLYTCCYNQLKLKNWLPIVWIIFFTLHLNLATLSTHENLWQIAMSSKQ